MDTCCWPNSEPWPPTQRGFVLAYQCLPWFAFVIECGHINNLHCLFFFPLQTTEFVCPFSPRQHSISFANSSHSNGSMSCNIREHEAQWIPDKIRMHQWLSLAGGHPISLLSFFPLGYKNRFCTLSKCWWNNGSVGSVSCVRRACNSPACFIIYRHRPSGSLQKLHFYLPLTLQIWISTGRLMAILSKYITSLSFFMEVESHSQISYKCSAELQGLWRPWLMTHLSYTHTHTPLAPCSDKCLLHFSPLLLTSWPFF